MTRLLHNAKLLSHMPRILRHCQEKATRLLPTSILYSEYALSSYSAERFSAICSARISKMLLDGGMASTAFQIAARFLDKTRITSQADYTSNCHVFDENKRSSDYYCGRSLYIHVSVDIYVCSPMNHRAPRCHLTGRKHATQCSPNLKCQVHVCRSNAVWILPNIRYDIKHMGEVL